MSIARQIVAKSNGIAARAVAAAGIPIASIRVDGGTQSRAQLQESVIEEYAAAIKDGATFPPVVIFYDGEDHWLADGFHRVRAFIAAGIERITADVRQGTRREAVLYSVGANEAHGLRRTNDDKRRAVLTLLNDAEWSKWSDREIAQACRVDHKTVGKFRADLTGDFPSERTYTTKHGTVATMNTAAIGKPAPEDDNEEDAVSQTAEAVQAAKRPGTAMYVPDGENIADLCRKGIVLEADGLTAEKAADELGIARNAYRVARQIVLLADNKDLSASDQAIAAEALAVLVNTGLWGHAWEIAEPLASKVWGEGRRDGLLGIPAKRLDQFERSFGIVMQACMTTDEIDLPYLTAFHAKIAVKEIRAARIALQRFADRIKRVHE